MRYKNSHVMGTPDETVSVLTACFYMIFAFWSISFTSVLITTSSCLMQRLCSPQIFKSNILCWFNLEFRTASNSPINKRGTLRNLLLIQHVPCWRVIKSNSLLIWPVKCTQNIFAKFISNKVIFLSLNIVALSFEIPVF